MRLPHAVVTMLIIIGATAFLTWVIPSGKLVADIENLTQILVNA